MPFEINKTELVWPGKYDADGNLVQAPRVSLPFQVIERVNETRATREAKKAEGLTLFDVWDGANEGATFEDGWRNKLIWGDNAVVTAPEPKVCNECDFKPYCEAVGTIKPSKRKQRRS